MNRLQYTREDFSGKQERYRLAIHTSLSEYLGYGHEQTTDWIELRGHELARALLLAGWTPPGDNR